MELLCSRALARSVHPTAFRLEFARFRLVRHVVDSMSPCFVSLTGGEQLTWSATAALHELRECDGTQMRATFEFPLKILKIATKALFCCQVQLLPKSVALKFLVLRSKEVVDDSNSSATCGCKLSNPLNVSAKSIALTK
jgi:hypothetical protein